MTSDAMKIAPSDNWGNVRVPRLDRLPRATHSSSSAWRPVPAITEVEQQSSLVGVPVIGLSVRQTQESADFSLETSYISLECSAWETFWESDPRLEKYKRLWRGRDPLRIKTGDLTLKTDLEYNGTFFLDGDMPVATPANISAVENDPRPRRLFFASARREGNHTGKLAISATQCTVTEPHVEAAVHCPAGSRDCRVTRMRLSLVDKRPQYGSLLDNPKRLNYMLQILPYVAGGNGDDSSPTELFLRESAGFLSTLATMFVNLSEVPPPLFSGRLMLVLNAVYQISQTYGPVFAGGAPKDLSAYGFDFGQLPANRSVPQSVVDEACQYMCTRSTEAVLTQRVQVYSYHPVWLALLFASSSVLLMAGVAGVVLKWRTRAPDVLGYAASMTFNNDYLPLPERGGVLDGMHRARILRDLPISISDVDGDNEAVGRVAFTSLANVRCLERGRKYI